MRLSELKTGEKAYIVKINGSGAFRKRILEMGFVRGKRIKSILNAPLEDPIKYGIMGYEVSLRRSEASRIEISLLKDDSRIKQWNNSDVDSIPKTEKVANLDNIIYPFNKNNSKTIHVALVGNPNAGKTSIFNIASGGHEHVGNYGGVTVDSKEGTLHHNGYTIRLIDLPGTYSLSAYTPEELYVRRYIKQERPDVIINVVAASAIERNLYLTTELIDMQVPMIIALNMYDELQKSGDEFDYQTLSTLLNVPIIPTVGKKGTGITQMLDEVIRIFKSENNQKKEYITIPYGSVLEKSIDVTERILRKEDLTHVHFPLRYFAIKLLEGDKETEKTILHLSDYDQIIFQRDKERNHIERMLREDPESAFTNARYGFIAGGLKETFTKKENKKDITASIDNIVTHKYLGFPIFFLFLFIMFEATFRLGEYPMLWIENLVGLIGNLFQNNMADGPLKDLIVDGIIGGVGGVIVFLPNIVILYLFISFMEDSGYMARAAFIMDKLMHNIGLHGKSFIPLIMGFGCNVPAIMSTRTIETRGSRMITMLIVPFMSCSARLPVYLLFVGTFFARHQSLVLIGLYATGILIAVLTALLLRKTAFKEDDTPFVMELPPFRMPTVKSILIHMWDRSKQYLNKMGSTILIASIVIWFLGYFPRNTEQGKHFDRQIAQVELQEVEESAKQQQITELERLKTTSQQESSFIGIIGKSMEPVMRPLGFNWKISVSLLSGMAAKEIVISTMGVIYTGDSDDHESLQKRIKKEVYPDGSSVYTPLVVIAFLLFILIYFPCVATIAAIKEESKTWKWALFSLFYSTALAWIIAFIVFQVGSLFA